MTQLLVATFNVHHGLGRDGILDFERCARHVRELGPDVIAVQELDRRMSRSGLVDQPAVLRDVTGLDVVFFPTLRRGGGEYGIAVAATASISARYLSLPTAPDEEPRGLIVAHTHGIVFCGTHLSRSRVTRGAQLEAVAQQAAAYRPVIVAGDLNATRREVERAVRGVLEVVRDPPPTHGRRTIDHVLAGPGAELGRVWAVATAASDHDLVAAEVLV